MFPRAVLFKKSVNPALLFHLPRLRARSTKREDSHPSKTGPHPFGVATTWAAFLYTYRFFDVTSTPLELLSQALRVAENESHARGG